MLKSILGAVLAVSFSVPAIAQDLNVATILPAGEFEWATEIPTGKMHIKVNLSTQMAYVFSDDQIIAMSSISSGKGGYETPTGTFPIFGKEVNHFSHTYKANMPFTQWLTHTGIALHSGTVHGQPSSHGCVHLPTAFAQRLFGMTAIGDDVEITHDNFSIAFAKYIAKAG